ncbi:MAG: LysR substrate-binding domain-containing protein [Kofleriaceae bacterium]|nr:LysR substrate-binding domain-containing protein [Kofleriaceae bacterium]
MYESSLRNVDLNLLLAFSVLMRERSVSSAARRLFIGQSGMSGILARLRRTFDDPLLMRVGRRLEPTPRALALVEEVDAALAVIERAIGARAAFDPSTCNRTFAIGVTDDQELLYAAALTRALLRAAPHARLVFRAFDRHTFRAALDEGVIDLAITVAEDLPSWHRSIEISPLEFECLWSPRQLPALRRLTLARFTTISHALVTFRGDLTSAVDEALAATGRSRRVVVGVSRFAALPGLLEALPVLCTVPRPVARHLAKLHRLATAEPPLEMPRRTWRLAYRARDEDLAELAWFRALARETLRG